jgi:hypothetical protein
MGRPHRIEGATPIRETLNVDHTRLLIVAEQQAVNLTRHPAVTTLNHRDLSALPCCLREARDRARTIGNQQGREIRGMAEPGGAAPAHDDTGTKISDAFRLILAKDA